MPQKKFASLQDCQRYLEKYIPKGIEELLKAFKDCLVQSCHARKLLRQHEAKFARGERDFKNGLLTYEELDVFKNRITSALLDLLDNLEEADVGLSTSLSAEVITEEEILQAQRHRQEINNAIQQEYNLACEEGQSELRKTIERLDITKDIGELKLVNCDRNTPYDTFFNDFDNRLDNAIPYQFYYIVGCPSQQPNSFAERMIYEIIFEDLEEDLEAISFERRPDNTRILFNEFPLSRNLIRSKEKFKAYFAKRFELEEKDFIAFLDTGVPRMKYDYVATVFTLNIGDWKERFMPLYLKWIFDVFSATHIDVPNFLFFFVFYIESAHDEKQMSKEYKAIKEALKNIVNEHKAQATFLQEIDPVPRTLLSAWIQKEVGETNDSVANDTIDKLIKGLKPEKQATIQKTDNLDMADIELFQELVYKVANKL